jgi:hypothetical protein
VIGLGIGTTESGSLGSRFIALKTEELHRKLVTSNGQLVYLKGLLLCGISKQATLVDGDHRRYSMRRTMRIETH